MKIFLQYMYLEWKRMMLSLPRICISSLLILLMVAGAVFVCRINRQNSSQESPVTIGVVAKEGEPFVDWMIQTVSNIEKTKDRFSFEMLTEKEAVKQLQNGKISIFFIIPENYVYSIINGENKHITVRFAQGQTTIISFLLRQLSEAASSFILDSEAGIYSMQEYYDKYHLENKTEDELALNLQYITEIARLDRGIQVEEITTNTADSYSLSASYLLSGIVLFAFLWGLTCSKILTSQSKAFQNQLSLRGIPASKQLLARNAAFFGTNLITLLFLTIIAAAVMSAGGFSLDDTILSKSSGLWRFFVMLLPVWLLAATFIQLIYEITKDALGGSLFLFFSTILMGLFSGCFYPFAYLPSIIQKCGKWLPVYQACRYGLCVLYSSFDKTAFTILILYSMGFYLVLLLVRHIRKGGS